MNVSIEEFWLELAFFWLLILLSVLSAGVEFRSCYMLGKCSATEVKCHGNVQPTGQSEAQPIADNVKNFIFHVWASDSSLLQLVL